MITDLKLISIVVPMYLEENVAEECYKRLTMVARENNLNYEIIFVNDGSTDKTLEILEYLSSIDNHVKVISFSRNFGHQAAITAGLDKALGDAVVIIDADLQDPPEIIPEMIRLWEKGYDVVYAKRKKREGETLFKLVTAKLFYSFLNRVSSVKIPEDTGDFRLIDRKVVEALKKMREKNRFIRGLVSWIGFNQISIEYCRNERFAGKTKYPLKKMIKLALDGIISFSIKPVRVIEITGVFLIILSIFTLIIEIFKFNKENNVLLISIILFIGGIQSLFSGILGEYIIRIYDESIDRPIYIIDKELNTKENVDDKINEIRKKAV